MDWISPSTYWHQASSKPDPTYPPLNQQIQADVAIIGAGITGLTAAMHFKNTGRRVVVLEAGRVGAGTTGGTSGHLDAHPDQGARKLIKDFGETAARDVTEGRMAAIGRIETWCQEYSIDCEFHRIPAYLYSESDSGAKELMQEHEALQRLGLTTSWLPQVFLPFPNRGGFRIDDQARFHSLKYLHALAEQIHGNHGAIYEHTTAHPPEDGEPCIVETDGGKVVAKDVLVCTHSAFLGISQFDMRIAPYQSYVITARVEHEIPDALFWDDAEPYHYIRLASASDPRLLIIGGCDHKTGQGGDEREAFDQLEQYARQRFPVQNIEQRWSAELFEPADGLPYVGHVPSAKHLYLSTGYSGTGLTFGTAAGQLLADLVLERSSPLAEIFSPARLKPMAASGNLLKENLNVAKHFVADRFTGDSIESLDQVLPGEGRLVKYNGNQWAVYRDEQGAVHVLSPVCTHMGCHVQWNEAEKTWDCPCHGGRYSAMGERLYGPPPHDLPEQPLAEL